MSSVMLVLGMLCAIVASILLYIFVLPDKKYDGLNSFFKTLHNIFNFKSLLIEKLLKFFYILSTMICIFVGFFMLFSFQTYPSYYGYSNTTVWYGGSGLVLMLAGPIVVRVSYEILMMFVILVKNTIQINNKMKDDCNTTPDKEIVAEEIKI